MDSSIYGLKLLTAERKSLTTRYPKVFYPKNEWIDVPGHGAAVAVTDGMTAGGVGPLCVMLECDLDSECLTAPYVEGARWFRRVRALPVRRSKLDPELLARYRFSRDGTLRSKVRSDGQRIDYTYNADGTLRSKVRSDGYRIDYNADGTLRSKVRSDGYRIDYNPDGSVKLKVRSDYPRNDEDEP